MNLTLVLRNGFKTATCDFTNVNNAIVGYFETTCDSNNVRSNVGKQRDDNENKIKSPMSGIFNDFNTAKPSLKTNINLFKSTSDSLVDGNTYDKFSTSAPATRRGLSNRALNVDQANLNVGPEIGISRVTSYASPLRHHIK